MLPAYIIHEIVREELKRRLAQNSISKQPVLEMPFDCPPADPEAEEKESDRGVAVIDFTI